MKKEQFDLLVKEDHSKATFNLANKAKRKHPLFPVIHPKGTRSMTFKKYIYILIKRKHSQKEINGNIPLFLFSGTQLQFIDVYVSNTAGDLSTSNLCASAAQVGALSSSYAGQYRTISCDSGGVTGRYLTLSKKNRAGDEPIITLCDIKINKISSKFSQSLCFFFSS